VAQHQLGKDRGPLTRAGHLLPSCDRVAAAQRHQAVEQLAEGLRVGHEVSVLLEQQLQPCSLVQFDMQALALFVHLLDQRLGHAQRADLAALAFDEHRPSWIERPERLPDQGIEALLAGLRAAGHGAEHRAAVPGQAFEIEGLCALRGQRMQQPGLAATGAAAQDAVAKALRQHLQLCTHHGAKGLVAALQLRAAKTDLAKEPGQRARALAAAPAIHQRQPFARLVGDPAIQVVGDVARHHRCAELARLQRRLLLVQRADNAALLVVQHRPVDCTG
jgi:hypothetical protein